MASKANSQAKRTHRKSKRRHPEQRYLMAMSSAALSQALDRPWHIDVESATSFQLRHRGRGYIPVP